MELWLVILLSLLALTRASDMPDFSPITSIPVLNEILNQQLAETTYKTTQSELLWTNATMAMANLNTALTLAAGNVSALYDAVGSALFQSTLNPQSCTVLPYTSYISNATEIQAFFCCHLRKIRIPAMAKVLSNAYMIFHQVAKDDDFGSTAAVIQGLQTMQYIDEVGFILQTCIDDSGILDAELASVRAIATLELVADLTEVYSAIYVDAISVAGCIGNPLAGCNQTTPLLWEQAGINMMYADYDTIYSKTCDLPAFNAKQTSSVCVPVSRF
jgi:hypothetical protein